MRLFVGLPLPAQARAALVAFRDAADPAVWRPVPEESLHITLLFLGERDDPGAIAAALPQTTPPLPLRLGRGLVLARVLAAVVEDPGGALAALHAAVDPAARGFRPHVTVARLRSGAQRPRRVTGGPEPVAFAGGPLTLYRSRLGRGPASYEPLWSTVSP